MTRPRSGTKHIPIPRAIDNWFDADIHALLMEAGICDECKDANTVHKYSYEDVMAAYTHFVDLWTWEDNSTHNKEAFERLLHYLQTQRTLDVDVDDILNPTPGGVIKVFY